MKITKQIANIAIQGNRPFNRYTLTYTATVPLRGVITYTEGDAERQEDFFLEAGKNLTFSSYIDDYLAHRTAAEVQSLTVQTISHDEGDFLCHEMALDVVPVLTEKTYYFENHRYRIGVELCWGGGLSCITDKSCPVEGLSNLLNHFDTGRLVQQSYYGTSEPPYVCGEFMGNRWGYNPVQGGDRGNHKSKLIEVRVSDSEVYVKCRPRDWGHDGGTTDSYMENWYRLEGDVLRVENRFVDFTGWTHPVRDQEVPAFYTVSYLNNYHWYGGDKPWTDDALSVQSNLPFWPTDWNACTFIPAEGNTEVWSAFADDHGYGLGLFTPGISRTLAGRHEYDGSKNPAAVSCGYIAPLCRLALASFKPIRYTYYIAAGYIPDIRAAFKACWEQGLANNGAWEKY